MSAVAVVLVREAFGGSGLARTRDVRDELAEWQREGGSSQSSSCLLSSRSVPRPRQPITAGNLEISRNPIPGPVPTVLMRLTALPVAIAVTVGLQIGFYVADLPLGAATLGAIMAGCAAYLLVRSRQAPEGER
jgi:hypothetical protein